MEGEIELDGLSEGETDGDLLELGESEADGLMEGETLALPSWDWTLILSTLKLLPEIAPAPKPMIEPVG